MPATLPVESKKDEPDDLSTASELEGSLAGWVTYLVDTSWVAEPLTVVTETTVVALIEVVTATDDGDDEVPSCGLVEGAKEGESENEINTMEEAVDDSSAMDDCAMFVVVGVVDSEVALVEEEVVVEESCDAVEDFRELICEVSGVAVSSDSATVLLGASKITYPYTPSPPHFSC